MKTVDSKLFLAHCMTIILWGSAFPGIRMALAAYSPEHLSLFRLIIGSCALIIYALYKKMPLPAVKDLPVIFLFGFLGFAVYQTALSYGEKTVSAGPASLLVSATPIFVLFFAFIFFREKIGRNGWLGALIAFVGIGFISFSSGEELKLGMGAGLILLAAVAESLYFVFQKPYLKKYGFIPFTIYTIWAATVCMLFYAPGLWEAVWHAPLKMTMTVVYLGFFPTVLAYLALAYTIAKAGASEATSSLFLTAASAFIIAWVWLGEKPALLTVLGGLITIAGVSVARLKQKEDTTAPLKSAHPAG